MASNAPSASADPDEVVILTWGQASPWSNIFSLDLVLFCSLETHFPVVTFRKEGVRWDLTGISHKSLLDKRSLETLSKYQLFVEIIKMLRMFFLVALFYTTVLCKRKHVLLLSGFQNTACGLKAQKQCTWHEALAGTARQAAWEKLMGQVCGQASPWAALRWCWGRCCPEPQLLAPLKSRGLFRGTTVVFLF